MKPRLITQNRVLKASAILLLLTSFLPTAYSGFLAWPTHLLTFFLQPATHGLKFISDRLGRPAGGEPQEELGRVMEDRDAWRKYSRRLEQQLEEARQTIDQITHMPDHGKLGGAGYVYANVTAYSNPGGGPMLTINVGGRDGIKPNWAVTSKTDLVGWVADVAAASSTVRLITVPGTPLHVWVGPAAAGRPARGKDYLAKAAKNGRDFIAEAAMDDPVREGDLATVMADSAGPEATGFSVGRVVQVTPSPRDLLRRQLIIRPDEPLAYLSRVVVIVPRGEQANRTNP